MNFLKLRLVFVQWNEKESERERERAKEREERKRHILKKRVKVFPGFYKLRCFCSSNQ